MLSWIVRLLCCVAVCALFSGGVYHHESVETVSNMARVSGYRYLAVSPRYSSAKDFISWLDGDEGNSVESSHSTLSCCYWLTKCSDDDVTTLLHEGANRLPLLLYSLESLDNTPFSLITEGSISVHSSQQEDLKAALAMTTNCAVVFDQQPILRNPQCGFVTLEIQKKLKTPLPFSPILPLYEREFCVGGSISWVTGISRYSPYSLCYALHHYSCDKLIEFLAVEYPQLTMLLQKPSTLEPQMTRLERVKYLDQGLNWDGCAAVMPTDREIFLRLANIAHELGGSFGPPDEVLLNSYPLFLSLLEQVGLNKSYGPIIEWFYLEKDRVGMEVLFDRVTLPQDQVMESVSALFTLFKIPHFEFETIRKTANVAQRVFLDGERGRFPTKQMYSKSFWEKVDPQHHYTPTILEYRQRFESLILENPESPWSGAFLSWLQVHCEKSVRTIYLNEDERLAYRAQFEGNKIVFPALEYPSKNIMYVIDEFENIYLAEKIRADEQTLGFHHSALLSGGSVVSAGKMTVNAEGIIEKISDHSGHYRPGPDEYQNGLKVFEKKGVVIQKEE